MNVLKITDVPQAMRAFYSKHGYAVAKGLLPSNIVDETLGEIHTLFAQHLKRLECTQAGYKDNLSLLADMLALFEVNRDAYLASARATSRLSTVYRLVMHLAIDSTLRSLGLVLPAMTTGPIVHVMAEELRIPGGYFGLMPHQDWSTSQGSLDTVTVWIPLVNVDRGLYPLQVIGGSHTKGLWRGQHNGLYYEVEQSLCKDSDFVSVEVEPGDVVFMSGFTVHRSGPGLRKGVRLACSVRYDNMSEPTYIERVYPCTYKRVLEQGFLFKEFPTPEQVAAVFDISKE